MAWNQRPESDGTEERRLAERRRPSSYSRSQMIQQPEHGTKMSTSENEALLADVEAYCQEVRPAEEIATWSTASTQRLDLAKKYRLFGMYTPKEYGGRGCDLATYVKALVRIGREGTGLRTLFPGTFRSVRCRSLSGATPSKRNAI